MSCFLGEAGLPDIPKGRGLVPSILLAHPAPFREYLERQTRNPVLFLPTFELESELLGYFYVIIAEGFAHDC